jgi:hypothetical protein
MKNSAEGNGSEIWQVYSPILRWHEKEAFISLWISTDRKHINAIISISDFAVTE